MPTDYSKVSQAIQKLRREHPERFSHGISHSLASGKGSKGKHNPDPVHLFKLSKRTVQKILRRLNIGCSRCGWNEAPGDIHHIEGRKIPNANDHKNLTYLCPNCHRLFHSGKIGRKDVVNLQEQIGDRWKEVYYG